MTTGRMRNLHSIVWCDDRFVSSVGTIEEQSMSLERDYEDLKAMAQLRAAQDPAGQDRALRRLYDEVDHHIRRQQDPGFSSGLDQFVTGQRGDSGSVYETVFYTPDNKEVIMLGRVIYDFIAHASR